MRVGIATDHGGFILKEELLVQLRAAGHDVVDFGAYELNPADDYPDMVIRLARVVAAGEVTRGIAICGSGVGASVAANKIPGIRAGLCHDVYSAHQGVEHDNANLLVLGSRVIGVETARELVKAFLSARFSSEERHQRRVGKIADIERRYCVSSKPA